MEKPSTKDAKIAEVAKTLPCAPNDSFNEQSDDTSAVVSDTATDVNTVRELILAGFIF